MKISDRLKISRIINKIWNLGHDNDDANFEWWEWNCLNPIKVVWKRKIALKVKELAGNPQSLLSLGCGCSPMINMFNNTPYKVGVDINAAKLQFLKSHTDAILIKGDITKRLPIKETFECVICTEVIEHFGPGELSNAFENFAKYCEDKLIISFPKVESSYIKWFESFFHGHLHYYADDLSVRTIDRLCKTHNFRFLSSNHVLFDTVLLYKNVK